MRLPRSPTGLARNDRHDNINRLFFCEVAHKHCPMKIVLAQINTTVGDFAGNLQKICDTLKQAEKQKADLVIFPELALSGYPPKDLLDRVDFVENNLKALKQLQAKVRQTAVVVGYVDR